MRLHPEDRVTEYRARGAWRNETWDVYLHRAVARHPDRIAVSDPPNLRSITDASPGRWTWGELGDAVRDLAEAFLAIGVQAGDVVGIQLPNSRQLAQTYLALARIGAIVSPFPIQFRAHELSALAFATNMRAIVTNGRIKDRPNAQLISQVSSELPSVRLVLAFGEDLPPAVTSLEQALSEASATGPQRLQRHLHLHRPDGNDCVSICWTSGTEDVPKGIPRTHDDWIAITTAQIDVLSIDADDVILSPFPMVNMAGIGGTFLPWLMTGSRFVLHHPFDESLFVEQIATESPSIIVAGPAILTQLVQGPPAETIKSSTLRIVGSGSSALPTETVRAWEMGHQVEVVNLYGSNEGVGLVNDRQSVPNPADRAVVFPRWGRPEVPWPGVRVSEWMSTKLIDVETGGEILGPGRTGELWAKGPGVFAGYLPTQNLASPFDELGYCRSGDLFEIIGDHNQFYRYVDRHKDIIIRGGFNISAAEVENLVVGHPYVAEAAAVGFPDPVLGERTCIFVVLADPTKALTLEDLCDYLRAQSIASYKLPERLRVLPSLPRNPLGKVVKEELRQALRGSDVPSPGTSRPTG